MQANYLGVYRALVTSVADPTNSGKIRTQCPQISGNAELRWAEPVNPEEPAPSPGTIVWVAFSGGDLTKPMYFNNQAVPYVNTGLPVNPYIGQIAFETTTNTMQIWDGSFWRILESFSPSVTALGVGQTNYAYLSTSQPYANTTTLTNVPGFAVNLSANAEYIFDGYLTYTGQTFSAGPGDLKVDWTVPSSAVLRWARNGYISNSTNQIDTIETDHSTIRVLGTFGTGTSITAAFKGAITTTNAGTLQLRAAQNSATATATTLLLHSWMRITRIL